MLHVKINLLSDHCVHDAVFRDVLDVGGGTEHVDGIGVEVGCGQAKLLFEANIL
jgi:hypothetical protein